MWTERLSYEEDTLLCEALCGQVIRHGTILIAEIVNKTSQESTAGPQNGAAEHMRSALILVHFLFSVFEFFFVVECFQGLCKARLEQNGPQNHLEYLYKTRTLFKVLYHSFVFFMTVAIALVSSANTDNKIY